MLKSSGIYVKSLAAKSIPIHHHSRRILSYIRIMSTPSVIQTKIPLPFAGKYGSLLIATMVNATTYGFSMIIVLQYFTIYSSGDPVHMKE
ncbi:hypothetical protein BDQ17DRAFT_339095 [Cyathus striatus]|nr:hypothetical protein BDQ17DRAFT_339095 [Cyathus striatus]